MGVNEHSQNQLDFGENTLRIVAVVKISNMKKPGKTRAQILKILKKLRKTTLNILWTFGVAIFVFKKTEHPS